MRILYSQFFQQWSFTSWHVEPMHRYSQSGAGAFDRVCIKLTPPPRVTAIENRPNPPAAGPPYTNVIRVTGRPVARFKENKAYGVS